MQKMAHVDCFRKFYGTLNFSAFFLLTFENYPKNFFEKGPQWGLLTFYSQFCLKKKWIFWKIYENGRKKKLKIRKKHEQKKTECKNHAKRGWKKTGGVYYLILLYALFYITRAKLVVWIPPIFLPYEFFESERTSTDGIIHN